MNIGFDAKRAFWNNTGLGNYSRFVISGMADFHPEHTFTLFSPGINLKSEIRPILDKQNTKTIDLGKSLTGKAKRSFVFEMPEIDIYHGLSNELPFFISKNRPKLIVSIHDLLFLRYPEFYPFLDRQIYKLKTLYACKKADLIIAISEQTKSDLINFLQIPESKIKVHYQSCHPQFRITHTKSDIQNIVIKYGITQPYILQVGTLENRKNALLTLKAFNKSKARTDFQLIFLGNRTQYCDELEKYVIDNNLSNKVQFIYKSSFPDFPYLFQGASLSMYPSLFEGFGIPVLEAMFSGTPVITSQGGCFVEVGGDAVEYIDPLNFIAFAEKIDLILTNKEVASDLILKGKKRSELFMPEKLINDLEHIYQSLLN